MSLYFVFLRRPFELDDRRSDPFWEFGSFGATGCHRRNLLNPNSRHLKEGDRLAFLQGGDGEIRVIGVTPAIVVIEDRQPIGSTLVLEARWDSSYRPLPYEKAPLLVSNRKDISGNFTEVESMLANVDRSSLVAKAASKFRSSTKPLPENLSREILNWFDSPGLPKVERYIDSIAPASTAWYQNADTNQWWEHRHRTQRYCECIGGFTDGFSKEDGLVFPDSSLIRKRKSSCPK